MGVGRSLADGAINVAAIASRCVTVTAGFTCMRPTVSADRVHLFTSARLPVALPLGQRQTIRASVISNYIRVVAGLLSQAHTVATCGATVRRTVGGDP